MERRQEIRAMIAVALSCVIFGFSFLFSQVAMDAATPFVLLTARFLLAFAIMNVLWLLRLGRLDLKGKPVKKLLLMGVLQPVLYFIGENYGVKFTSSAFGGVMIALVPVVATLLAVPVLRERPSARQLAFILCSLVGVAVATLAGSGTGAVTVPGFLLLLLAVFSGAGFNLAARDAARQFTAFERTYMMFALGSVFFVALGLWENGAALPQRVVSALGEPRFLFSVIYLGGLSSVGAFFLHNYAITFLPVARATVFSNVTTVVAVLAGVLILREPFSLVQAGALALILIGVYGANRKAGGK